MPQAGAAGSPVIAARIEIGAPPARVWQALSDARELTRWFAPHARVSPGVGGSIRLSWGDPFVADWRIEEWRPSAYLKLSQVQASRSGPQPRGSTRRVAERTRIATFVLSGDDAKTDLTLLDAGYADGANPDALDSIARGSLLTIWARILRSLELSVSGAAQQQLGTSPVSSHGRTRNFRNGI